MSILNGSVVDILVYFFADCCSRSDQRYGGSQEWVCPFPCAMKPVSGDDHCQGQTCLSGTVGSCLSRVADKTWDTTDVPVPCRHLCLEDKRTGFVFSIIKIVSQGNIEIIEEKLIFFANYWLWW